MELNLIAQHAPALNLLRPFLSSTLALLLLSGCAAGDGNDENDPDTGNNGDENSFDLVTDENGSAATTFNVPGGTTKLQVVAQSDGSNIRVEQLTDSRDVDYLSPQGQQLSLAEDFGPDAVAVTAPSRDVDPGIDSGEDFRVRVGAGFRNSGAEGVDINLKVLTRRDLDLSSGTLKVNIFYVGAIGSDPDFKAATRASLNIFRSVYGGAGIGLDVTEREIDGPALVPNPYDGSSLFLSAARQAGDTPAVNIFIAGDLEGFEGQVYGISGGIPGPAIPTTRSGVVVSMITSAGLDGNFNDEEIRILGETLAHEAGHFLGLFHPVDFDGEAVADSDPLSDTPTCRVDSECENVGALIANLMYTTPIPNGAGGFVPQNQLSGQQRAVLNRAISVD